MATAMGDQNERIDEIMQVKAVNKAVRKNAKQNAKKVIVNPGY